MTNIPPVPPHQPSHLPAPSGPPAGPPAGYPTRPTPPQEFSPPPTFSPPPAFSPPRAPDARPKTMAIIALCAAGFGFLIAFIPFVSFVSGIFLLTGLVLGLIALISKKQGGMPLSITAIALSAVGWIVSIIMTITWFAVIAENVPGPDSYSYGDDDYSYGDDSYDDDLYGDDSDSDSGNDGFHVGLEVAETAFGYDAATDSWWYAVAVENPNLDDIFEYEAITVEALDASGMILDSETQYPVFLAGQTMIVGSFYEVGSTEIVDLDVLLPSAEWATMAPLEETGYFAVSDLATTSDEYGSAVTGTISSSFFDDQEFVTISVVARDAQGKIVDASWSYVDRVPAVGRSVQFRVDFYTPLPEGTTVEASAAL